MLPFKQYIAESRVLKLWRGCREDWESGFTKSYGEAGYGIYAFIPNTSMAKYYTNDEEELVELTISVDAKIIDFTSDRFKLDDFIQYAHFETNELKKRMPYHIVSKVTKSNYWNRFGNYLTRYITERYPDTDVYIVPHSGPNIPTGKQAIIRNDNVIMNTRRIR